MKIKITSDSTCDLTPELLKRFDISICPLYVIMDGVSYRDGIDITADQIFAHVAEGGSLCSTAAVSEDDYKHFFARELEGYDGLVHITISSEMSACYQNALRAARKFENIHVVDSRNLSSAQGLLVMEGAEMAQRGDMTAEEISKALRELAPKIDGSFVVDRLEYLRKGGRCSTAAALGANLLAIKPCIEVRDGNMLVAKKYRGKDEVCRLKYMKDRLSEFEGRIDTHRIVLHTTCDLSDKERKMYKKELKKLIKCDEIIVSTAGCVITSHCGPGTFALFFLVK